MFVALPKNKRAKELFYDLVVYITDFKRNKAKKNVKNLLHIFFKISSCKKFYLFRFNPNNIISLCQKMRSVY